MKKKGDKKHIKIIIVILFFALGFIFYYTFVSLPIIKTYSKAETQAMTDKAVNIAVSNVVNRSLTYGNLIDITYSQTGEIVAFSANQYEINAISREIIKETQSQLKNLGENGLKINLGTLSGFSYLIGRGPLVAFKLVPIGTALADFESDFNSVGINMTKHSLFLNVKLHISIALPVKSIELYTNSQVLLSESIIVGKVPEVYLNGGGLKETLNLIP